MYMIMCRQHCLYKYCLCCWQPLLLAIGVYKGCQRRRYPIGANVLTRDFYVDDLISGANSAIEATEIKRQLTELLALGSFQPSQVDIEHHFQRQSGLPAIRTNQDAWHQLDP